MPRNTIGIALASFVAGALLSNWHGNTIDAQTASPAKVLEICGSMLGIGMPQVAAVAQLNGQCMLKRSPQGIPGRPPGEYWFIHDKANQENPVGSVYFSGGTVHYISRDWLSPQSDTGSLKTAEAFTNALQSAFGGGTKPVVLRLSNVVRPNYQSSIVQVSDGKTSVSLAVTNRASVSIEESLTK